MENNVPNEWNKFYLKDVSFVNLMMRRIYNVYAHKISSCSKVDVARHPSSGIVLLGLLTTVLQRCHHTRFQSCAHGAFDQSPNKR